jgi:hypothetical protein
MHSITMSSIDHLRRTLPSKLPKMTECCWTCKVQPSPSNPIRAIVLPGNKRTKVPRKSMLSLEKIGDCRMIEPWQDMTLDTVTKYRSYYGKALHVECSVCHGKRLLLDSLTRESQPVPWLAPVGSQVLHVLRTWPELRDAVSVVTPSQALQPQPAATETEEWARSLVRIVAVAQRELWIYEYNRRQVAYDGPLGAFKKILTEEENTKAQHLLSAAHVESINTLVTWGEGTTRKELVPKRGVGRPNRKALAAVLKFLVHAKIREKELQGGHLSISSAIAKCLPVLVGVCVDLRDEYRVDPGGLVQRLRQYC